MEDYNCITLVKELCESFFEPFQKKEISVDTLHSISKKILSLLFTFRNDNSDCIEFTDPYSLLRIEIHSRLLTNRCRNNIYSTQIDNCLQNLKEIYEAFDEKDEIKALFILLYKLSDTGYSRKRSCNEINIFQQGDNTKFSSTFSNMINWNTFYKDPFSIKYAFNYPFYEPPTKDIPFIKNYCPDFETLNNDFNKFFEIKYKLWRFDLMKPVELITQDEGFVTPGSEFSNEEEIDIYDSDSTSCSSENFISENQVLKLGKRTWEQLGKHESFPEVPFSSEHLESVIHFWKIWNANQNFKRKTFPLCSSITFEKLKTDIHYLLFGMDSHSFYYNCLTKSFNIRDKLHLQTLTPEIVLDFCEPLMQCASFYRSLKTFVERRVNLPFGPAHRVFCRCINQILNMYRYSVLNINWENVQFVTHFDWLILTLKRKLMFLVQLCLININETLDGSNFPSGTQLLDYLYDNLIKVFKSDFGFILFHIFENCCNVYLKVVSEWMFDGCFSNPENYEEFFIEINREDEICRDWKRVSCIKIREKQVPKFLEKFYKEIFLCGKSVNLLKIFTTKDISDSILQKTRPNMMCCFNKKQFDEYLLTWQQFQAENSQHFNSREKIKSKLRKKFNPDFYEQIKQIRANWFDQYEKSKSGTLNDNIVSKEDHIIISETNDLVNNLDISKNSTVIDSQENNSLMNNSDISKNFTVMDSQENNSDILTYDSETNSKTKTKKLVEFYEKLNDSINEEKEQRSSKMNHSTPEKIKQKNANRENTKNKIINDESTLVVNDEISNSSSELKSCYEDGNEMKENEVIKMRKYVEDTVLFGDYKCNINVLTKTENDYNSDITENNDYKKNAKINQANNSIPLSYDQTGAGDVKENIKGKKQISKSKMDALDAAGDASHISNQNVLDQEKRIKIITKPCISTDVNEYEKNKFKSMYSDHQIQLNSTYSKFEKKIKEIPMNDDYTQNKLNNISNNCQNHLNKLDLVIEEKSQTETPMNALLQNKNKVMSSEYHQRLMDSEKIIDTTSIKKPNIQNLTESEKNKLKIMSSEYHLRLMNLDEQKEQIEKKLISQNINELNERDLNKLKVLSSEYHNRLMVLSNIEKTEKTNKLQIDINDSKAIEQQKQPSEYIENFSRNNKEVSKESKSKDLFVVLEEGSEESKSDDFFTVLQEVIEESKSNDLITVQEDKYSVNSILENEQNGTKQTDGICVQQNNIFDLKNYISYKEIVFPKFNEKSDNNFKEIVNSIRDVNRTSLFYYLSQSILIPLKIQSKIVNEAVLRVFIEEEGYLNHLTVLRNYFLLKKPEFSLLLTNTIFEMAEKVKRPYFLLNNYTLNCILQQALLAGTSKESMSFERKLSFVIKDTVPHVFDLMDIKALSSFSLNYSVKWPINVLITETITKKYSRIFKFLMQIQRACWVLKSDFRSLKNLKQGRSIQYLQIQLYRHNMMQIIRILQEFLMRESLEKCWNDLVDYLSNSEISLDDLYMSHLKYVNKIMQRCFLCDVSVSCHESILNLLSSILKYHAALRAGSWQRNVRVNFLYHTNFKNIHIIYEEFRRHLNDIQTKLNVLIYTKQKLYFQPLLLELSNRITEETN